jgi:hypothetical protein
LNATDSANFHNLDKGYQGEIMFDDWVEEVSNDNNLILHDLLLEYKNTIFQIDSLLLISNTIHLFEVKNYKGDYVIEGEKWYSLSRKEIKNPLLQLKRTESLLRQLLQEHGFDFSIEAYVVFINPEFQLYLATANHPIVFPSQLRRFMEKLKSKSAVLKASHKKLANQLLSLHVEVSPYTRMPEYQYADLEKGILCPACQKFYTFNRPYLYCDGCGGKEFLEPAVLRSIEELILLFPEIKITTKTIQDWCKIIKNIKTIRKILTKNYKRIRHGKASYYINRK